jgi:hypothetical protein
LYSTFHCTTCGKGVPSQEALQAHELTHLTGGIFDLCLSEVHIYINDIYSKFPSRITVAHSIPESYVIMLPTVLHMFKVLYVYMHIDIHICIYEWGNHNQNDPPPLDAIVCI